MKSVVAAPSCTQPVLWILPVSFKIRSVVVVLPASTCANIPIFLYLDKSAIALLDKSWGPKLRVSIQELADVMKKISTIWCLFGKKIEISLPFYLI